MGAVPTPTSASPSRPRGPWPTDRQTLLLQAALGHGAAARHALARWEPGFDPERIDPETLTLLPLLARNLESQGITSPFLDRYLSAYRWSWYRNQHLFAALRSALVALTDAGVGTILLKGAALAAAAFNDEGARPMGDGDVLVPDGQAARAAGALRAAGFLPTGPLDDRVVCQRHSIPFRNAAGIEIDLHWHVLPEEIGPGADDAFWDASEPLIWKGLRTRVLCPADHLLLIVAHAAQGGRHVPPIYWMADAVTLVRSAGSAVDWTRLVQQAFEHRLTLAIRRGLDGLASSFDLAIPADVHRALAARPVSPGERIEYWLKNQGVAWSPLGALPRYWFTYARLRARPDAGESPRSFTRFLKERHDITTGEIVRRGLILPFRQAAWLWRRRTGGLPGTRCR
jgi:hypothetical protein